MPFLTPRSWTAVSVANCLLDISKVRRSSTPHFRAGSSYSDPVATWRTHGTTHRTRLHESLAARQQCAHQLGAKTLLSSWFASTTAVVGDDKVETRFFRPSLIILLQAISIAVLISVL